MIDTRPPFLHVNAEEIRHFIAEHLEAIKQSQELVRRLEALLERLSDENKRQTAN